jgi:small-conductance mechanosensitive channel
MKKLFPTIALIICSMSIVSCGNSESNASKEPQANNVEQVKTASTAKTSTDKAEPIIKSESTVNISTDKAKQVNTVSNSSTQTNTQAETKENQTKQTQTNASERPEIAIIKNLVSGDIMCYVDVVDENGKEHHLSASFEICEQKNVLNKKVRLTYEEGSVNDCQSAEPCGKSRIEILITKAEILPDNS